MKKLSLLLLLPVMAVAQSDNSNNIKFAEQQTIVMLKAIEAEKSASGKAGLVVPRSLTKTGALKMVSSGDWVSGFFPGELWCLYEYTGNKKWRKLADEFTHKIEKEQFNTTTHDVGFMVYCSAGNGYRLTGDKRYRTAIVNAARSLATRFNPTVGCIRSWDDPEQWHFPVIIDNMMNLELLFSAGRLTGDSSLYNIAVTHANTTMFNHFRDDYSSYHVVDYDSVSGKAMQRVTHQGYADASAWARGQAWGLYGFTVCYRETRDVRYLQQAERIARFIMQHPNLTADKVPYWDFNDPSIPNVPRDASAAAIIASALYELSAYSKQQMYYLAFADTIIASLGKGYHAKPGASKGFILEHSTGHKPAKSEIDVPIIYADYYYLEALTRKKQLKRIKNFTK